MPAVFTSTEPVTVTVTAPSTASVAVAPGSENSSPKGCVILAAPVREITGAVVSANVVTVMTP